MAILSSMINIQKFLWWEIRTVITVYIIHNRKLKDGYLYCLTWQGPVVAVQIKTLIGLGVKVVTIVVKLVTAAHADGVASTSLKFDKSFVYIYFLSLLIKYMQQKCVVCSNNTRLLSDKGKQTLVYQWCFVFKSKWKANVSRRQVFNIKMLIILSAQKIHHCVYCCCAQTGTC